jgi:hypothetical protein
VNLKRTPNSLPAFRFKRSLLHHEFSRLSPFRVFAIPVSTSRDALINLNQRTTELTRHARLYPLSQHGPVRG